jgi:hypothetical protein
MRECFVLVPIDRFALLIVNDALVGEWDTSLDEIGSVLSNRNSGFYHDEASGMCGACRSIESVLRTIGAEFQVLANNDRAFIRSSSKPMRWA